MLRARSCSGKLLQVVEALPSYFLQAPKLPLQVSELDQLQSAQIFAVSLNAEENFTTVNHKLPGVASLDPASNLRTSMS